MRTLILIAGGFLLLGICLFAGRLFGRPGAATMVTGARVFIVVWLAVALLNLWMGISRAGYTWAQEVPIFVRIFVYPAGAAALVWWKLSRP
jgi:hypothetical protein